MSGFRKIIPFFCVFSILFSLAPVPASAAGSEWGIYSFWDQAFKDFEQWLGLNPEATPAEYEGFGGGARDGGGFMNYWRSDSPTCTSSDAPGGYHYIDPDDRGGGAGVEGGENVYMPRCLYCHELFKISGDSLGEAYDNYVSELPASGIDSNGYLYWTPSFSYGYLYELSSFASNQYFYWGNTSQTSSYANPPSVVSEFNPIILSFTRRNAKCVGTCVIVCSDIAPVDGYYYSSNLAFSGYYILDEVRYEFTSSDISYSDTGLFYTAGTSYSDSFSSKRFYAEADYCYCRFDLAPIRVKPLSGLIDLGSDTVYNINSRPTSVTGDYGIIGDDGQIIKVDTSTIINETNNTYTNPSTGTTSTITDWTYDYSDRSYNVTLESGDTVTVTYGDEVILIQEGDTTYNIYYITQGTGGGGEEEPGTDTCQHTYSSSVTREPTCTVPGQTTYTCSLCGHTYTESIPATGHTWTVLQSVTTEYDQEGNLIQQGYTLYQCSICGEQYKDEDGTGPPGSGEDGGGESIWDKLGNFLGGLFGGVIGIIEAVLGKILDALAALTAMIAERLAAVVELVLSFFDEIPHLFVGFLGFLGALFPFLPEEVMLLLTFGIAVLVFIGIIKALRR